jgi:hypothetical protein
MQREIVKNGIWTLLEHDPEEWIPAVRIVLKLNNLDGSGTIGRNPERTCKN